MATYNGEAFLQEQLTSLLNQTFLPHELIVCDDGSSDSTLDILERFKKISPFPCYIYMNKVNKGTAYSFKKAIDLCKGDIIAFCDQDDVWLPNKLQEIEDAFNIDSNINYVITNANIVNVNLNYVGYTLWEQRKFSKYWQNRFTRGNEFDVLFKRNIITGMTTAISRKVINIGYDKPETTMHDAWYIYIAILSGLKGSLLDLPLVNYRQHPNQQYGASRRKSFFKNVINRNYQSILLNIKILEPLVKYSKEVNQNNKSLILNNKLHHLIERKYISETKRYLRPYYIFREIFNLRYFTCGSWKNIIVDFFT